MDDYVLATALTVFKARGFAIVSAEQAWSEIRRLASMTPGGSEKDEGALEALEITSGLSAGELLALAARRSDS